MSDFETDLKHHEEHVLDKIENKELLRKIGNRMNGTWTVKEILEAIRALEEKHASDKLQS